MIGGTYDLGNAQINAPGTYQFDLKIHFFGGPGGGGPQLLDPSLCRSCILQLHASATEWTRAQGLPLELNHRENCPPAREEQPADLDELRGGQG
jgi:hypothetical protein